jgi:ubiquinone/menaquinone biosynthesis C-methylase UbiE
VRDAEFNEPRLVEIYDIVCPWGREDDFFLGLANETPGSRLVDYGCGTGRLALGLAAAGHVVTGVDPARASLDAARRKVGAQAVRWVEGLSDALPAAFDTALMTSHVAQFVTEERAWATLLADLRRALVAGGRLAFESRDPAAREWERWNPAERRGQVRLNDGTRVEMFTEVVEVAGPLVTFVHHYRLRDGEELLSRSTLRFRPEAELRSSLAEAGFIVEAIYGGWGREAVGQGDGEFIVVARAV